MNIILVITNARRRNLVFISDSLKALSLQETIRAVSSGIMKNLFVARGKYRTYVRSIPNTSKKDNLDARSVSVADIIEHAQSIKHTQSTSPIGTYTTRYVASFKGKDGPLLKPVGEHTVRIVDVKNAFVPHAGIIMQAAKEFDIDPYLLGAILIDEIARMAPFENIIDFLGLHILRRNVSVGLAQVKLETANGLIKKGLYHPNPDDKKLPFTGTLSNKNRERLYRYVIEPKHNIRFAAARIRGLINEWSQERDISDIPEVLGTLYHRSYVKPHTNPTPNDRGKQIAKEFYRFAKQWLGAP